MGYEPSRMIEAIVPLLETIRGAAERRAQAGAAGDFSRTLECCKIDRAIADGTQKSLFHLKAFSEVCTARRCPDLAALEILQEAIMALHGVRDVLDSCASRTDPFQQRIYAAEEQKLRAMSLSLFSLLLHACVMRIRDGLGRLQAPSVDRPKPRLRLLKSES